MGADFLLYHCEYPHDTKLAVSVVERRINNLSRLTLNTIADDVLWRESEEIANSSEHDLKEGELFNLDELIEIKTREMVRERIREAATELLRGHHSAPIRRDITTMEFGGILYLFTGGMSYGDHPTDAVYYLELVNYSGIFDDMGHKDFDYEKG
jgi:hypothetical protein